MIKRVDGKLVIKNALLVIEKPFQGAGLGAEILGRQVEHASKWGLIASSQMRCAIVRARRLCRVLRVAAPGVQCADPASGQSEGRRKVP